MQFDKVWQQLVVFFIQCLWQLVLVFGEGEDVIVMDFQ